MQIDRATTSDLSAVVALLADARLPLDGAAEAFTTGVVARDGERLVGAAALEPYGDSALLRSVVVAQDRRGSGIARHLVTRVEDLARQDGVAEIYPITETAADYFPRLGYAEVPRETVPEPIAQTVEFTTACSMTAMVMRRTLGS